MIPFTSAVVLSVVEIEIVASSAATWNIDISKENLCSFDEVFFDRMDCAIEGIPHRFVSGYWCVTYVLQYTHIVSQFLRIVSSERNNVTVETVAL